MSHGAQRQHESIAGQDALAMMVVTGIPYYDGLKPRSFSSLMDIFESNFIRLRKLIPDLDILDCAVSSRPLSVDLRLTVLERGPYTTTIALTYNFAEGNDLVAEPDLIIRIYHDARLAEVMSYQRRGYQLENDTPWTPAAQGFVLERKWRINRFLQKWLGYCLHQGHCFSLDQHPRT